MGQKVNPFSLRLPITKDWQSKWFGKGSFTKQIAQDLEMRQAILKKYAKNAGISKVEILRDADTITLNIFTSKPGVMIGRSGQGINDLRSYLYKTVSTFRLANSNKLPRIKIEILEVKNAEVNAKLIADNIAVQIEKRIPYKRATKQAIAKATEARAKGIKIQISGRLGGAEIARSEKYGQNSVPLGKLRADIDFAHATAMTTYGTVGIKVWVYKGDRILEEA